MYIIYTIIQISNNRLIIILYKMDTNKINNIKLIKYTLIYFSIHKTFYKIIINNINKNYIKIKNIHIFLI